MITWPAVGAVALGAGIGALRARALFLLEAGRLEEARENAELSGLGDRPVRWLTEDARKWVQREARRGALYDGIILDPPKFGRGPGGEVWRLLDDLPELIAGCAALLSPDASFLLMEESGARGVGVSFFARWSAAPRSDGP